ncbi:MAG: hypothetical protein ACRDOE_08580, partial [Streptosporangiaceae bacterium]
MATRPDTQPPAPHLAGRHDLIRVHGARVNNLKDISVEIPKRRLTVFTGVSGSGKSSLAFGTIAAESQRLINETYSAFVQGFMPTLARPEVDVLEGLTTAIIVDQQRMGADARSTVGTATDANAMLRILFSRLGQPHIGSPNAFSFNVASVRASGAITVERESLQPHVRAFVDRAVTFTTCPECGGTQLSEAARSSRIGGINIADACAMQISDLAEWVRGGGEPSVAPLLAALQQILDSFAEIGLGYLSLDRPSGTLSGGEAQRVKMIRHLGSSLTDVTYVFDEPTTGLHPHDIQRMNELLLRLRDKGNTVLVVEHEPETIAIADHVVDLGPGAGTAGGTVCFEGTVEGLRASGTITGRHFGDRMALKEKVRTPTGALEIRGASAHNLQDVDVDIPLGVLVVVTGVAGSGKSSLVHGSIPAGAGVVSVDQTPIKGSRRSNPATYTGLLDPIRTAFAKANGVKPALFSANSEGACPNCNGVGVTYTDLAMMAGVATTCEECEG